MSASVFAAARWAERQTSRGSAEKMLLYIQPSPFLFTTAFVSSRQRCHICLYLQKDSKKNTLSVRNRQVRRILAGSHLFIFLPRLQTAEPG